MAERVFLSFDYEWNGGRAHRVAAALPSLGQSECAGLINRNEWHKLERFGPAAQKNWIDGCLASTTVTAVLIAGESESSSWVHNQIQQSRYRGHGLIGIRVHRMPDPRTGRCDYRGRSPFESNFVHGSNPAVPLSEIYPVYDWIGDDGPRQFSRWVTDAGERSRAQRATTEGRRPTSQPIRTHVPFLASRHVAENWTPAEFVAEP